MSDKIIISADCVCDLPENLIREYSIQIIPFYIQVGGARFQDYMEVDFSSVYEYMEKSDEIVSSSAASVEDYQNYFLGLTKDKSKTVIHICASNKLSKAYSNALAAAQNMENVHVVDSGLISHGMGLLVLKAAELAKADATVETVLKELREAKNKISCSFVLKSTQYVANNKRLNQMISNLLDIFRIKPIIKIKHDEMKVRGICLGSSEAYVKKYIRHILRSRKYISDRVVFITVLSNSEELRELAYREVTRKIKWKHVYMQDASVSNFCNVGLGSVGIMFYTK